MTTKPLIGTPMLVSKQAAVKPSSSGMEETIRRRAYQLYEQRGRVDGHELDDWLQAETELSEKVVAA